MGVFIESGDIQCRSNEIKINKVKITDRDEWTLYVDVECEFPLEVDMSVNNEYNSVPVINSVSLTVTSISLSLSFGDGYDDLFLNEDAIERIEEEYGDKENYNGNKENKINNIDSDLFIRDLDEDDLDFDGIRRTIADDCYFDGAGELYSEIDIDDIYDHNGYNKCNGYKAKFDYPSTEEYILNALDNGNVCFEIIFNNVDIETVENEQVAIELLKKEIEDAIQNEEEVDITTCFVRKAYEYLVDESTGETELDTWDKEIVYEADSDPDYEDLI